MSKKQRPTSFIAPLLFGSLLGLVVLAAGVRGGVDADPAQEYPVTPAAGQWLVCTASYRGDSSGKLAHDLVLELRQRYKLPAYSFNRGARERAKQQEDLDRERQQQRKLLEQLGADPEQVTLHRRTVRIDEEYAVLVGGYKDIDTARRALDSIKKLAPPRSVPLDVYHNYDLDRKQFVEQPQSPFLNAFVARNPTVPTEGPGQAADPFLKKLNAYESYSLLRCQKPYTLLVKEFQGARATTDAHATKSLWDKLLGDEPGMQLEAAGHNAHNLAEVLHKMGWEAYVLHARYSSIVTVGGFDGTDDPHMREVAESLVTRLKVNADAGQGGLDAQKLNRQVQLIGQPVPIPVPRP